MAISHMTTKTYQKYTETLLALVKWLLNRGYDVTLLIAELRDPVSEFRRLLDERLPGLEPARIQHSPVTSVEALLTQFVDMDFVIATRFHNIVFSLRNGNPVISISFHPE
jgi:polysaccharide pyruvyl transferase WcaK-like protein